MKHSFEAMVFAAGLGTRLYPLTQNKPKALVEVAGKTLLEHTLLKLKNEGASRIVINVHHFADLVVQYLEAHDYFGLPIYISNEKEQLLDTGGGLQKAAPLFSGKHPILIHNIDIISSLPLQSVLSYHQEKEALATLCVRARKTSRHLLFDQENCLCGWENNITGEQRISRAEKEVKRLAFSGIHIINPALFKLIDEKGVFSIIDLYLRLAQHHKLRGFIDETPTWMDLGKLDQLAWAEKLLTP